MSLLPVASHRSAGDAVLVGPAGAVDAASFFAQVARLAPALPEGGHVINLCETRHGFMTCSPSGSDGARRAACAKKRAAFTVPAGPTSTASPAARKFATGSVFIAARSRVPRAVRTPQRSRE